MADKTTVLADVTALTKAGEITYGELTDAYNRGSEFMTITAPPAEPVVPASTASEKRKLNASYILFYVGALIVYTAIATFLGQSWESLGAIGRVFFTLGLGFIFWLVAARLLQDEKKSDAADGVAGAILLIGNLSVSGGVFVTLLELAGGSDFNEALFVIGFAIIASMQFGIDMIVRKFITRVFAAFAVVGTYFSLVLVLVGNNISSPDFWGLVSALGGLLLIGIGSVTAKIEPDRLHERSFLWAWGGFAVMGSLYTLTFVSDVKFLWQLIFPVVIYGAFIASIKAHSKNFLYSGAVFLFVFIIGISFEYFGSGLGAAGALLVAGFSVIGSGVMVQNLKKKYFSDI